MLAIVYGTSCSGKSTLAPLLAARRPELDVHDFDAGAGSPPLDLAWRRKTTESWIRRALAAETVGRDAVLFGGVAGELLASPSAVELAGIALCLLDCSDEERVRRLRARYADEPLDPRELWDHVAWGVWLRFHSADPGWFRDPLLGADNGGLRWERWNGWARGDPRWRIERIDSTGESATHTAARLDAWLTERQAERDAGLLPLSGRWWDYN